MSQGLRLMRTHVRTERRSYSERREYTTELDFVWEISNLTGLRDRLIFIQK